MPAPTVSSIRALLARFRHPRRDVQARHLSRRRRPPRHVQRRLELRSLGQLRPVHRRHVRPYGFLDRQRFMLSLDAGRNPVTGQIQCRSQFDPTAAQFRPSPATAAPNHGSLRGHRGLRALQSVRRGRQLRRRPTISRTMHRNTRSLSQLDLLRASSPAIRASCSTCRAARSASRSVANIGGRRPATRDPFVRDRLRPTRLSFADLRSADRSR